MSLLWELPDHVERSKRIRLLLGDHVSFESEYSPFVNWRSPLPSGFITKMWAAYGELGSCLMNAILGPGCSAVPSAPPLATGTPSAAALAASPTIMRVVTRRTGFVLIASPCF